MNGINLPPEPQIPEYMLEGNPFVETEILGMIKDYAIAAIEKDRAERVSVPDMRNLLSSYERQWHRMGELWERCQGKGWPQAEDSEFTRLRDEITPSTRAKLLAAAPQPKPVVQPVQQAPVGTAGSMPGTDGFTMACFKAEDVPIGTTLYIHPAPQHERMPLTEEDLATLSLVVEEFDDCGETCVDAAELKRLAGLGYLECTHYEITTKARRAIEAAHGIGTAATAKTTGEQ